MKKSLLNSVLTFIILNSLLLSSFGQAPELKWSMIYGNDEFNHNGYSVIELPDGGFIIAGTKTEDIGAYKYSVYVFKINAEGTLIWEKTYGASASGSSMTQASDGGIVIAGSERFDETGLDAWILKISPDGNFIWSENYGGTHSESASYISPTSDNGFIITGSKYIYGKGLQVYLVKVDENGEKDWEQDYGDEYENYGYCVRQTSDGGYIIAGISYRSYSGNSDIYIIKTNDQGVKEWEKIYGDENSDWSNVVIEIPTENSYLIVGQVNYVDPNYSQRLHVACIDGSEEPLWSHDYEIDGISYVFVRSACITQDGNLMIGITGLDENYTNAEIMLVKIDLETRELLWSNSYGYYITASGGEFIQTTDFGYLVLGSANGASPVTPNYVYLMRLGYSNETTSHVENRTNLNIDISSAQTTDNIVVNDVQTEVLGVTITIDYLIHPNVGDLELVLEHDGEAVKLVNQPPNSGENFTNTMFFDPALIPISSGYAPYTGIFKPEESLTAFNGSDPNGDWTLRVINHAASGLKSSNGTLNGWTLKFLTEAGSGTGIHSPEDIENFLLYPCYPNPLNEETRIEFKIPKRGHVNLSVYNHSGQIVKKLVNTELNEGEHTRVWNAQDVSAGTYFLHLESNGIISVQKLIIIK